MHSPIALGEFERLEEQVRALDPAAPACRTQIGALRREMDRQCDQGNLSIRDWRRLLDQIAAIQARLAVSARAL